MQRSSTPVQHHSKSLRRLDKPSPAGRPDALVSPTGRTNVTGISWPTTAGDSDSSTELPPKASTFSSRPKPKVVKEEDFGPLTPVGLESLDGLWDELRLVKEGNEAKTPPKVASLGVDRSFISSPPSLKRKKSHATFRASPDGRTMTATFDLPGIRKEDAHVSFQRNRLVVEWTFFKTTEVEEKGKLIRDRQEVRYNRTIPLPAGTKFSDIKAAHMNSRHLVLTYPALRSE